MKRKIEKLLKGASIDAKVYPYKGKRGEYLITSFCFESDLWMALSSIVEDIHGVATGVYRVRIK